MNDLELTSIRVFREIVESGSFAAAADRLGMAAPQVSKQLARLEGKLGARLLNRTSRRVSLTEVGTMFHEQSRLALETLDDAVASVGQAIGAPRGELKVSAPTWCASRHFVQLVAQFRREFPEVRLDLHLDNHMADLASERFDIALRMTTDPSAGLIARPLCEVAFRLVATPDYLGRWRSAQGSEGRRSIDAILPNYLHAERLKLPGQHPGYAMKYNAVLKSSDTHLSYQAALADMGAAFLPEWLIGDDLAAGRLVAVDSAAPPFSGTLLAVYVSRRHLPPKLRSFIEFFGNRLDRKNLLTG